MGPSPVQRCCLLHIPHHIRTTMPPTTNLSSPWSISIPCRKMEMQARTSLNRPIGLKIKRQKQEDSVSVGGAFAENM